MAGLGVGVAIKSSALLGHVKSETPVRPARGQDNWTARHTSLGLRGVGRAENIIQELLSAGSVAQMPYLFSCLGLSQTHYGKFPVALLRKVETVFLGLSY